MTYDFRDICTQTTQKVDKRNKKIYENKVKMSTESLQKIM